MKDTIDGEACITTDLWTGYKPLEKVFPKLSRIASSKKGENFPLMHRFIMGFKSWLRGTHHHVSKLQAYVDEYTYRINRHLMKKDIFNNLFVRMINHSPCPYKLLNA